MTLKKSNSKKSLLEKVNSKIFVWGIVAIFVTMIITVWSVKTPIETFMTQILVTEICLWALWFFIYEIKNL